MIICLVVCYEATSRIPMSDKSTSTSSYPVPQNKICLRYRSDVKTSSPNTVT